MSAGQQQQQQQAQAAPQPKPGGNWLTHLLPTVGGIAGALLAPETGGLSLLAAAGLSGLGTAAGKAAENATEGDSIGNGVVSSGLEGAAGGAIGGVAGKALGKAGDMLGSRAENITNATQKAADATAERQAGVDAAQATRNNYGISDKLQGGNHLALGTNQKFLDSMGYDSTDPYQMAKASEVGYHPTDLSYNSVYDDALQNAKPVDMSNFGNDVYKTMQQTGTTDLSTSPLGRALQDFHNRTDGAYSSENGISLPSDMSAADVRKLQQAVGREQGRQQNIINNAENSGQPNIAAESAHNTLSTLYDQLGSKIKTPEVDQAIAARTTTPEERAALVAKFGDQLGNHAADTIDNAQSASDLLKPMQQTTQMAKAGEIGIDNIENKTGTTLAANRAKMGTGADGAAEVPATPSDNASALHDIATTPGVIGKAAALAKHGANNPNILNVLSRIGDMGEKLAPPAGVAAATAAGMGASPVALPPGAPGIPGQGGTIGGTMNGTDTTPNDTAGLMHAIAGLSVLDPTHYGAQGQSLLALEPFMQKNQLLAQSMQGNPALFANAGGAQGLAGILSRISGLIPGTAAHTYEAQQNNIAQQLGINPAQLPGLMQNQQTAGMNQSILGQMQGLLAY